jgi:hypothetical protein
MEWNTGVVGASNENQADERRNFHAESRDWISTSSFFSRFGREGSRNRKTMEISEIMQLDRSETGEPK